MNLDFSNLTLPQIFEYIRIGIIIFDFLLVAATIHIFMKAIKIRPRFRADINRAPVLTIRKEELLEKWNAIMEKYTDGKPDNLKIAVIQGDAMIDGILKNAGLKGEHMADRLDNIEPGELKSFEDLWRSHKIRNNIVHNEAFVLNKQIAETAIKGYEKFLKELGVLTSQ
ncbi:MAG: Uncharacterized protein LiPW15_137 [Parcubacteria group bacterium LiPW_15]|nr:MAG: Uncharacterized protein LiPW15_137 [Parcubacteria group bacterium LiPW_15]